MATFILTWNPQRWDQDGTEYQRDLDTFERVGEVVGQWSTGNRTGDIAPGDRAFLLRQHRERGIITSGEFTSPVFQGPHWDGTNRDANYAMVRWDIVLPIADRLPVEDLMRLVSPFPWDRLQASGIRVPDALGIGLEATWARHLLSFGRAPTTGPDEIGRAEFVEGAVQRVMVNRYERDPSARAACVAHYGKSCSVCSFDFEKVYGQLGRGYIHVHHVRELSSLGPDYRVDPVRDLRPVCPNCHAMLHQRRPAFTVSALRKRLGFQTQRPRARSRGLGMHRP